jgi:hypothetical protein
MMIGAGGQRKQVKRTRRKEQGHNEPETWNQVAGPAGLV